MRIKRNRSMPTPGVGAALVERAAFTGRRTDKLAGFWKSPKKRPEFRPLKLEVQSR